MTKLEAIKRLEYLATETTGDLAGEQGDYAEFLVKVVDALDMAIAALREQDATDISVGHKTNADHIRSMTDEELAAWFDHAFCDSRSLGFCQVFDGNCEACALSWLKQPYKEDT